MIESNWTSQVHFSTFLEVAGGYPKPVSPSCPVLIIQRCFLGVHIFRRDMCVCLKFTQLCGMSLFISISLCWLVWSSLALQRIPFSTLDHPCRTASYFLELYFRSNFGLQLMLLLVDFILPCSLHYHIVAGHTQVQFWFVLIPWNLKFCVFNHRSVQISPNVKDSR